MTVESELHIENAHTADRSLLTGRTQKLRIAELVDGASADVRRKIHLIKPMTGSSQTVELTSMERTQ